MHRGYEEVTFTGLRFSKETDFGVFVLVNTNFADLLRVSFARSRGHARFDTSKLKLESDRWFRWNLKIARAGVFIHSVAFVDTVYKLTNEERSNGSVSLKSREQSSFDSSPSRRQPTATSSFIDVSRGILLEFYII